jgi:hypothetical protein
MGMRGDIEVEARFSMKRLAMVGGICTSFLLGAALTAVAQDEHRDERPSAAPQERQEQPRPQEQANPGDRQNENRQNQDRPRDDRENEDRRNQEPQSGDRHDRTPQSEGRQPQEPQNRDRHMEGQPPNQEHGRAGEGQRRRIPDNDFHAHFGRPHRFAVGRLQTYQGRPSFVQGGYTFVLVEPWPSAWVYDADDCYIDYVDGDYWLFNVMYPGERVQLFIVD